MTLAQKAAWHDQVSHIMTQMGTTEKIRALKAARKEKAAAEGTPEQKTQLTPMEMMAALRARAEQIADEREGGNSKQTDARKVYKDELLKKQKSTDQGYSKKKTQEEIYKDFGLWALPLNM